MYYELRDEETYFAFDDMDEFNFWTSRLRNCSKDGFLEKDMDVLVHCVYELRENMVSGTDKVESHLSGEDTAKFFGALISLVVGYHSIYGKE